MNRVIALSLGLTAALALAYISAYNPMDTTAWLLIGGTITATAVLAALVYVILSGRRHD